MSQRTVKTLCAFTLILGAACSGGSDSGSDDDQQSYLRARKQLAASVTVDVKGWSEAVTPYIDELLSGPGAPGIETSNEQSGLVTKLCDSFADFRASIDFGSDELRRRRLDDAERFLAQSASDEAVVSLLTRIFSKEMSERDRILAELGGGGLEGLRGTGALDSNGALSVPPTEFALGSEEDGPYSAFREWVSETPGIVAKSSTLIKGLDLDGCGSE